MNDSSTQKRPRGTRWCSTGIWSAAIGAAAALIAVLGAQAGLFSGMLAFSVFGIGLLAFIVSLISNIVGLLLSKGSAGAASSGRAWGALVVALTFFAFSLSQRPAGGTAPIHDITTDVGNPPQFSDAMIAIRAGAQNPPEYAGEETAKLQREAYPDIQTVSVEQPTDAVFAMAESVVRDLGWEIVTLDVNAGRIEATDTTSWFGFEDDVVIQLTPRGDKTYVNLRSKSRVGRGDMGANAARIREFIKRLDAASGA